MTTAAMLCLVVPLSAFAAFCFIMAARAHRESNRNMELSKMHMRRAWALLNDETWLAHVPPED